MARGRHPNSLKALEENRIGTQFSGERAVEMAHKSQDSQAFTKSLLSAVAEKIDVEKAATELAAQIEDGNLAAWKIWCEYNAARPTQHVEADITQNVIRVTLDD